MKLILAVFLTLFASASALADTCSAGLASTIVGVSCTIGDKTFSFNRVSGNVLPTQITFTPDSTNPNSPGFILTAAAGVFSVTGVPSSFVTANFELLYSVALTNGATN